MRTRIFILSFLAAVLSSCEIPFELDNNPAPELYVQCLPSNEYGQTRIRIQYSQSVAGNRNDPGFKEYFYPDSLRFKVNGKDVKLSGTISSWTCDWQALIKDYAFQPGDRIQIYVKGGDAPSVRASTVMPPVPVIKSIEHRTLPVTNPIPGMSSDTTWVTTVRVTLPQEVKEGEYYGLQALKGTTVIRHIREKGDSTIKSDTTLYFQYVSAGQLAAVTDLAAVDLDAYAQVNYENNLVSTTPLNQPMMLLTPRQFNKDSYTFYLGSMDSRNWDALVHTGSGDGLTKASRDGKEIEVLDSKSFVRYQLYLYRLSDELYRYCKAQFLSYFNALSNFGLTPPNFTYSNIQGGIGVLGGMTVCQSEWFTVTQIN